MGRKRRSKPKHLVEELSLGLGDLFPEAGAGAEPGEVEADPESGTEAAPDTDAEDGIGAQPSADGSGRERGPGIHDSGLPPSLARPPRKSRRGVNLKKVREQTAPLLPEPDDQVELLPLGDVVDPPGAGLETGEFESEIEVEEAEAVGEADSDAAVALPPPASRPEPREAPPPPPPAGEAMARARELVELGKAEAAVAVYRGIIAENPRHLKAHNNLGVLYDEAGWHERALEHFEAARAIDPDHAEILMNTGAALGALGRYEEAERELRRALRVAPDNPDVRANLGILFLRRGLNEQAEAELRWVCERNGDHGTAHFYRAEALNRLGRVDDALRVLERAVELQPQNAKAWYTMGILLDKKNLPVEAALMYRRSREVEASA